jgi:hypothetical protein
MTWTWIPDDVERQPDFVFSFDDEEKGVSYRVAARRVQLQGGDRPGRWSILIHSVHSLCGANVTAELFGTLVSVKIRSQAEAIAGLS